MHQDNLTLETPEHVELHLELAGVGSRFAAAFVDSLIQVLVILVVALVLGYTRVLTTGDESRVWLYVAIAAFSSMLLIIVYYIVFEMWWGGQSPGKRLSGLVVVRTDGSPIGFQESAIRNILRLIDILPVYYTIGMLSVFFTKRCQRLGDLAAGTIVIKVRDYELEAAGQTPAPVAAVRPSPATAPGPAEWGRPGPPGTEAGGEAVVLPLSGTERGPGGEASPAAPVSPVAPLVLRARVHVRSLTPQETDTLSRFMERRFELDPLSRAGVAARIAASLRPKFPAVPPEETPDPEVFLDIIWQARQ